MKLLIATASFLSVVTSFRIDTLNGNDVFEGIKRKYEAAHENLQTQLPEDARLLVPELIEKYGYPSEIHTVQTEDGYILEMHRIPYGKSGPSENRTAVYLQHGILCSSAVWIIPGPGKGFGYILADAGYDVWLPNVRGTRYSRKHIKFDPDKNPKEFWDFSWHEIGIYDVPAMIDSVIQHTGQSKIFYIGHSQGTTVSYVLLSEKKEYNDKLRAVFSLAPVAYMGRMTSPLLKTMATFTDSVEFISNMLGIYEFLPRSEFLAEVGETLCGDESVFQVLCTNSLFAVCGFNRKQMNATLIPVILGHTPAGTSTKQMIHYGQEIQSGKFGLTSGYFRQYDYGFFGNMKNYGRTSPPKYKLKNVKAPVYLHYSRNDWLSNTKDVDKLAKELGNLQGKFLSPDNKFNHIDYLFGIDAPDVLYNRVLRLMKKH